MSRVLTHYVLSFGRPRNYWVSGCPGHPKMVTETQIFSRFSNRKPRDCQVDGKCQTWVFWRESRNNCGNRISEAGFPNGNPNLNCNFQPCFGISSEAQSDQLYNITTQNHLNILFSNTMNTVNFAIKLATGCEELAEKLDINSLDIRPNSLEPANFLCLIKVPVKGQRKHIRHQDLSFAWLNSQRSVHISGRLGCHVEPQQTSGPEKSIETINAPWKYENS